MLSEMGMSGKATSSLATSETIGKSFTATCKDSSSSFLLGSPVIGKEPPSVSANFCISYNP
jgi:hypothetical protein